MREAGLEPARAYCTLEPESSESANSTTRAFVCAVQREIYNTTGFFGCQYFFESFLKNRHSFSKVTLYKKTKDCYNRPWSKSEYASVVQWIERQIPVLNVGGSSPFGRARNALKRFVFTNFFGVFCFMSRKCPEIRPGGSAHHVIHNLP